MPPLLIAALVVLLEGLSLSALFPILHKYAAQLGHYGDVADAAGWIGALFAMVAGPKVIMNPVWGTVSDRVGRKPVLVTASLGTIAGSIGWALAPSLGWLALTRVVVGVFGAQAALASAIAADVSTPQRRAASMAALGAAFGVAFTLGPLFGGLVGSHFGYASVGWLCAGFQTVSLTLILTALRETRSVRDGLAGVEEAVSLTQRPSSGGDRSSGAPTRVLRAPHVVVLLGVTFLMMAATAELIASFGVFTADVYGFTDKQTAYAFAFFGFVTATMQGTVRPLVTAAGERRVAALALAVMGVALGLIGFRPPPVVLWAALAVAAGGGGVATSCLTAMLSHVVVAVRQGRALGLQQSTIGLARATGYLLGGGLYAVLSSLGTFGVAGALAIGGAVWLGVRGPRSQGPGAGWGENGASAQTTEPG